MTMRTWFRVALGYLTLISLQIGIWALAAPRSFYDDFPGLGRTWVSVDGPYNEHLVRDVGGLYLALAAVTLAAAVSLSRALIITASLAALVTGVPHALYHAANTGDLPTGDAVASLIGLVLSVVIPVVVLAMAIGGRGLPVATDGE